MKKIIFQGLTIVALFFITWLALSKINWVAIFKVEKLSKTTEEKLGDLFWDMFNQSEKVIRDKEILAPIDSIITRICTSNNIDRNQIKLHIIQNKEINAFALPNKHLVIYTGLISAAENEAELSGVIGHELAHMEMSHVMKKLIKEVGLSVLISMSTGNNSSEVIKETAKLLSSTAFDRNLEKEADMKAVDYLINSDINPESFANFLYKMADDESKVGKHLSWISTHPNSRERAEYIIQYSKTKSQKSNPILTQATWNQIKTHKKSQD